MGENNIYDTILHKILRYDMIWYQKALLYFAVYTSRPMVNCSRLL